MGAAGRIDTREAHRGRGEPVHPDPRCKGLLIRDINHALRRYRNLVSPPSEGVREVENVPLLAADVRREELGEQQDAHQRPPGNAAGSFAGLNACKVTPSRASWSPPTRLGAVCIRPRSESARNGRCSRMSSPLLSSP